jgi:predicted transcriptional regulator
MNSAKTQLLAWVKSLPDDCDWEDLAADLELRAKVARGLADVRAGRVVSQEEAERRSAEWLSPYGQKVP